MKGNILLQTVVCSTLIVPGVFLETFLRSRENEQRSGEQREKNFWLRLACSASVFWAGESCFVLLQIAVAGIFDFMTEEDGVEEIANLRVGARAMEGEPPPPVRLLTCPISSSLLKFQQGTFASKNIRAFDENACTAG